MKSFQFSSPKLSDLDVNFTVSEYILQYNNTLNIKNNLINYFVYKLLLLLILLLLLLSWYWHNEKHFNQWNIDIIYFSKHYS